MKRSRHHSKSHAFWLILPIILIVLIIILFFVIRATSDRQKKSAQQPASEPETAETETTTTGPEMLRFVDVPGNVYEIEVNPDIKKHPYDLSKFYNDEQICTYEDDKYTSRLGVDVANFQGDIDWPTVKAAGIDFAFIRLGYRGYGPEGSLHVDELFDTYMVGAQEAGVDVGVYFFSQAVTEEEAIEEAEFCLNALAPYELQLPVVFDSENIDYDDARTDDVSGEQFTNNAIAFCERIKEAGYDTAIYSNMKWEAFTYDLTKLADYPIWYADYELLPQTPYDFTWWQYTSMGYVDGIPERVDRNMQIIPK